MGAVDTTNTFTATDVITSTKMNNIIDQTVITSDAIIGSTLQVVAPGKLQVAAGGITSNELTSNAVTTLAITDANVTPAKLANADFGDFTVASGVATLDNNVVTSGKILNGAITAEKIAYSNFPIQIVQAVKTDTQDITGSASIFVDITGLSITLTRVVASSSGKVRIQASVCTTTSNSSNGVKLRILRDGVAIGLGDSAGSRLQVTSNTGYAGNNANVIGVIDFIDTTPGSAATVTYKIQGLTQPSVTGKINKTDLDTNSSDSARSISTLTLTELTP